MRILGFIPARFDSKRFPGKPLAMIAGKPMIQHVYRCASGCSEIQEVIVATDDERIFRCVEGFGGKAVLTNEVHPSGTDRIAEAVQSLKLECDDLVINIQGDQPFFKPSLISSLIKPLLDDPCLSMGTLKVKMIDPSEINKPNFVKVVTDREGFALLFSRSPIPFFRDVTSTPVHYKHLGFYGYRVAFLTKFASLPVSRLESAEKLEQLRALEYGYKIRVVETSYDSVEVDSPKDIKIVEDLMKQSNTETK